MGTNRITPFEILLVEDNAGDARLLKEAFRDIDTPCNINVVKDGVDALRFLYRQDEFFSAPRPDLILLDLNLPRKDGREVLADVKQNESVKSIPVIVLTTSSSEKDIQTAYGLYANSYIKKPVDLDEFEHVVKTIEQFWLKLAFLPEG
ncbi:response regulator [Geovibrio sp. ADMFC3]